MVLLCKYYFYPVSSEGYQVIPSANSNPFSVVSVSGSFDPQVTAVQPTM